MIVDAAHFAAETYAYWRMPMVAALVLLVWACLDLMATVYGEDS